MMCSVICRLSVVLAVVGCVYLVGRLEQSAKEKAGFMAQVNVSEGYSGKLWFVCVNMSCMLLNIESYFTCHVIFLEVNLKNY